MFCPKGPVATAQVNNPGSVDLSGVTLENATVLISAASPFMVSFGSLTFTIHTSGEHYLRIPVGTTIISVSPNTSADIVVGEDL